MKDFRQRKYAQFLYRDCRIMIANIHILVVEGVLTYLFLGDQGILAKLLRHCFHDPNNLKQKQTATSLTTKTLKNSDF